MEIFKLIVATLISPLLIALGFLATGWLLWWRKKRRLALILLAAGSGVLLLGSLPVLSGHLNRARGYKHPPLDPALALEAEKPVLVVILGTGFNPDPYLPPNSQVSANFHARLIEGVRIYRSRPDARLLVSVAGRRDEADKRKFIKGMVNILSLDPERVGIITEAESTTDEAVLTGERLEDEQLVVVTSAGHMPRAIKAFQRENLRAIPAPADFYTSRKENPHARPWQAWIPSSGGIGSNRQMIYELLASAWKALGGD